MRLKRNKPDFADSLKGQADAPDKHAGTQPSLTYLTIRTLFTAHWVLKWRAWRTRHRALKTVRIGEKIYALRSRVVTYLSGGTIRERMKAVTAAEKAEVAGAHLVPWIILSGLLVLKAAMAISEPIFISGTVRVAMNIPESAGAWDVKSGRAVATVAGIVVGALLLLATSATAKGIAWSAFAPGKEAPPRWQRAVLTAGLVTVLTLVTTWLHSLAEARVNGVVFTASTEKAGSIVVWLITLLPILVTALQIVTEHPDLKLSAAVRRWTMHFKIREIWSTRREAYLLLRQAAGRDGAQSSKISLGDAADLVGLRADNEHTQAALKLGYPDAAPVTEYTTRGKGLDHIDGAAAVAFTQAGKKMPLSHLVAQACADVSAIKPAGKAQLPDVWRRSRAGEKNLLGAPAAPPNHGKNGHGKSDPVDSSNSAK